MLSWIRGRVRSVSPAVLLALLTLALPHGDAAHHDGDAGLPSVVVHDASDHTVGAPALADAQRPDHCAVCHWSRTFSSQARAALVTIAAAGHVARIHGDESTPAVSGVATQPPLRAPPSSPAVV